MRFLEHRPGQIDPDDGAIGWIQRDVHARPDADLEHPVARLERHSLDGPPPARLQRRPERQIVEHRELFVDSLDEVVLDGGD